MLLLGYLDSFSVWKYFEKLCDLDNDLSFLPGKLKIENVKECVANLHDKNEYVIHIKEIKTDIKSGISFRNIT